MGIDYYYEANVNLRGSLFSIQVVDFPSLEQLYLSTFGIIEGNCQLGRIGCQELGWVEAPSLEVLNLGSSILMQMIITLNLPAVDISREADGLAFPVFP